ncbi:C3 and PZP-like alpha-2-macroglobulin domain-containing protein 8 [Amphibalanus amphitrite]|uniref:C3 and PZP-like alpha-2-macroglobulin domain-containing protein 8 n=2 Tax=Amphibalanus amphitrite TaxID=1232801 RepID=A0A6A4VTC9_AMPAM|nr:uncharacterized protein LOC122378378 isoform X1 [Amphibalanus amphitrite]XP_043215317.1 uncharacterized protein LOC122378378 isoform X1 [Amphibalanus amphitrite]KAF0296909.1 C3 and PZP-like alpha-2-macroglobulin domain-containing protein 8 [Amphibalanus amphitrite]KAF0298076.1 C3 and PZP-like alpha-2-macroglobulin domain-containing protein 8 [Amphibalanus amphitrite]
MGNEHGKEIDHDDHDGEYAHFSRITRREVRFHVRASCTASVALTSADHVTDDLYEVHFGSDGNTRCIISRNGDEVASCDTPDILDGDEPRGFWIRWKPRHGRLLVGRDGERLPFMMHMEEPLLPISHYAIRVEAGGSGSWRFPDEDEFSTSSSSSSSDDEDEEMRAETKANSEPRFRNPARWKWARDGHVPGHGVVSGEGNEGIEYVGRAYHEGALCIGRIVHDHKTCYIPYYGEEVAVDTYQALVKTNERLEWVDASNGEVPRGALQGGHNSDGHPLFVARAEHDGNWCCGHLNPGLDSVYIPYGGEEHQHHQYQVLCATTINLR